MKKRLFISSILMTLVLLVAITTATFAWYSVSKTLGSANGTSGVQTLTSQTTITAEQNTVAGDLTVTATEGTVSNSTFTAYVTDSSEQGYTAPADRNSSKLQLIGFNASHEPIHKYWSGASLINYAGEAGLVDYAVYEIKVHTNDISQNINGSSQVVMTAAEAASALSGKTITFTLNCLNTGDENTNNRIGAYMVAAAPSAVTDDATTINSYVVQSTDVTNLAGDGIVVGYLVVYLKGDVHTTGTETNDATTAVDGRISITLGYQS